MITTFREIIPRRKKRLGKIQLEKLIKKKKKIFFLRKNKKNCRVATFTRSTSYSIEKIHDKNTAVHVVTPLVWKRIIIYSV